VTSPREPARNSRISTDYRATPAVTQKFEPNGQRQAIETSQGASTMPDADGGHENKPGFGDKVGGFAKKFAGKATGKVSSSLDVMNDGRATSMSTRES